jgi:hypothetical protein
MSSLLGAWCTLMVSGYYRWVFVAVLCHCHHSLHPLRHLHHPRHHLHLLMDDLVGCLYFPRGVVLGDEGHSALGHCSPHHLRPQGLQGRVPHQLLL